MSALGHAHSEIFYSILILLQSQLRTNLISELQQSVQGPLTIHDLDTAESDPLLLRAANSLVADHLRRTKYEYTLGVFLPESGLAQDKVSAIVRLAFVRTFFICSLEIDSTVLCKIN